MPIRESGSCQHERRPGTVVCLYCRHEEQLASKGRRRARRGMLGAALLILAVAAGVLIATRSDQWPIIGSGDAEPASPMAPAASAQPEMIAPEARPIPAASSAAGVAVTSPARPIIAEGRTSLPGGLYAVRTGDTVEVHFDTPENRTRRRDKFERVVRETLPTVYGTVADEALAGVPAGQLVADGELPTDLTERGVRLRTAQGGTLMVWPSTIPGRDGPLVVAYRTTILR